MLQLLRARQINLNAEVEVGEAFIALVVLRPYLGGPYSNVPLNAVRKSLLSRDGVAEDNWMWMMATCVAEANANWTKQRKEAVRIIEGVDGLLMGGATLTSIIYSSKNIRRGRRRRRRRRRWKRR